MKITGLEDEQRSDPVNVRGYVFLRGVLSGQYQILPLFLSHLAVLFGIYLVLLEAAALMGSLPYIILTGVLLVLSVLVYAHMLFGYLRVFLLGSDYSSVWVTKSYSYSSVQESELSRTFWRFLPTAIIFMLSPYMAAEVSENLFSTFYDWFGSGFSMLIFYGLTSFAIWSAFLIFIVTGSSYVSRSSMGDRSVKPLNMLVEFKGEWEDVFLSNNKKQYQLWIYLSTLMIWLPEFAIALSDMFGVMEDSYDNAYYGGFLLAFEVSLVAAYKYCVIAGLAALIFLNRDNDVRDHIGERSDAEILEARRKASRSGAGSFIASMDDQAQEDKLDK